MEDMDYGEDAAGSTKQANMPEYRTTKAMQEMFAAAPSISSEDQQVLLLKASLIEEIEKLRPELCDELGAPFDCSTLTLARKMRDTLVNTSVYSCELRRWFRASEQIPKLLAVWTTVKFYIRMLGLDRSGPKTYWGMLYEILCSEEAQNHLKRIQIVAAPLAHECGRISSLACSGGPSYAIDRVTQLTHNDTLAKLSEILNTAQGLRAGGAMCVAHYTDVTILDATGTEHCALENYIGNSETADLAGLHQDSMFHDSCKPLLLTILSMVSARTQSNNVAGVWQLAHMLTLDVKEARKRAHEIRDYWLTFVCIEQWSASYTQLYKALGVFSESVVFRNAMLRVEQWCAMTSAQEAERQPLLTSRLLRFLDSCSPAL